MQKCRECGKDFEPFSPLFLNCPECNKKLRDRRHKNKIRHGGKREKIISGRGLVCSKCGKIGNRFEIITHHVSGDSQDHRKQVNLCRACHMLIHDIGGHRECVQRVRQITKEMVVDALKGRELEDACKVLGITRSALYKLRKAYGLTGRRTAKVELTKEQLESVSHLPQKKQGELLGVSRSSILKFRKLHKLQ